MLEPAAEEFARVALAQVEPTCFTLRPSFFIAHRRLDGEQVVRAMDQELCRRGYGVFRDLGAVGAGGRAQQEIEVSLAEVDALIYVDTPQIGGSRAATEEVRRALLDRVPIIWVRLDGAAEHRDPLTVVPGGSPDIERLGPVDEVDSVALVDEILGCHRAATAPMVAEANELMADLVALDGFRGARVARLPGIPAGFRVEMPRTGLGLPARPLVHACQIFGRRIAPDDARLFMGRLTTGGAPPSVASCDAVVLLDPRPREALIEGSTVIVSGRDYLERLGAPAAGGPRVPRLLLSGSWSAHAASDDEVLRAVGDLAEEWIRLGGGIVCGGHPTFTPVLVGAARRAHPYAPEARLAVFQTEHLASLDHVEALGLHATVITTRDEGDRGRSLASMRDRMMRTPDLVGLVAVGGRDACQGVDDEILLAQREQVPVALVAAPGGRVAEIAREWAVGGGWSSHSNPPFEATVLRDIARRTDYRGIARDLFAVLA